ncbi:venom allergen 5-like [Leptopilina boulardi]|uniref:venom allergen 5-like n=1 Tax=Leptopilina boulardi TaxID=63433 RepID=UPI0021F52BBD|nr:venom allergen 5-like [Leptopilina boulardi]
MSLLHSLCFLFTILTIVVLIQGQEDYCSICPDHTMCRFRNTRPVCNARVSTLTTPQILDILRVHNEYRQRVASGNEGRGRPGPQPPARNMPNLFWDWELAIIAQRWAFQCRFAHDSCRNTRRFQVGQNVATAWTTGSDPSSISDLIKMWYDEVELFDRNQVEQYVFNTDTGHYTQMVWATTRRIGCGYINHMSGNRNTVLLVCNYGPAGNIRGEKIYEIAN